MQAQPIMPDIGSQAKQLLFALEWVRTMPSLEAIVKQAIGPCNLRSNQRLPNQVGNGQTEIQSKLRKSIAERLQESVFSTCASRGAKDE